jgi:hypothetical protein
VFKELELKKEPYVVELDQRGLLCADFCIANLTVLAPCPLLQSWFFFLGLVAEFFLYFGPFSEKKITFRT